jgi:hypothetical protein
MSEQHSDKLNPRADEEMKHELGGLLASGRQTHAQEWRQVEPSGEDQPDVDRMPNGELVGGTPAGLDGEDVQRRSDFATFVSSTHYPAARDDLVDRAVDSGAPDWVLGMIRSLPADRQFANLSEIWTTLGGGAEAQRF